MPLVEYSDSDDEGHSDLHDSGFPPRHVPGKNTNGVTNRLSTANRPPPLPASFQNLYATAARASTSDDPSLHGGRKRATPHVEGNWPTHVYLEWFPSQVQAEAINQLLEELKVTQLAVSPTDAEATPWLRSLLQTDLGVAAPLHISLSRSLGLQGHQREAFRERLEAAVRASKVEEFDVVLTDLKWVSNHERNRWFLVLSAACHANELNMLLHASNKTCTTFDFPELYTSRSGQGLPDQEPPDCSGAFHFSVAWTLEELGRQFDEELSTRKVGLLREHVSPLKVPIDVVKLKMGNVVNDIPLKRRRSTTASATAS